MSKLYWIETWGCQMNEHDSEKMAGILTGLGYEPSPEVSAADLVLLNTCAIREKAEEKVYATLAKLKAAKKARPEMIIGVAGCVAQMTGTGVRERMPMVDLVMRPRAASRLPEHLARIQAERGVVDTTLYQDSLITSVRPVRGMKARGKAYVTVMEGCNKSCSYCIVPTTRGREDSRTFEKILEEVQGLADEGYLEVEFLGQNVNAYRCPESRRGLADLLIETGRATQIKRLRFATSHPVHLDSEIIRSIADVPQACDFLHLPVQSGSTRILKAMRRGYSRERYLAKIQEVREVNPSITLSTDMIVGFPGETEEDFQQTLSLMREVRFDQMFSFIFSARPGTSADMMVDTLTQEQKVERLMELQALQRQIQFESNSALIDCSFEVIVEAPSRRDPSEFAGRTSGNRTVNFAAPGADRGQLVWVTITGAGPNSLKGELIEGRAGVSRQAS